MARSPQVVKSSLALEVYSKHKLTDTATGIVRSRKILISGRHAAKTGPGEIGQGVHIVAGCTRLKVDVVESVQELYAHFNVDVFGEPNLLGNTQVETEE